MSSCSVLCRTVHVRIESVEEPEVLTQRRRDATGRVWELPRDLSAGPVPGGGGGTLSRTSLQALSLRGAVPRGEPPLLVQAGPCCSGSVARPLQSTGGHPGQNDPFISSVGWGRISPAPAWGGDPPSPRSGVLIACGKPRVGPDVFVRVPSTTVRGASCVTGSPWEGPGFGSRPCAQAAGARLHLRIPARRGQWRT